MIAVQPKNGIAANWLYWQLLRIDFADFVQDGALPSVNQKQLSAIKVPVPESNQQEKITQILDTLDTTIRQTEAIIAKLQQVKQGLLHDLLTRGIDANGQLRPPVEQAPHLYKESPLGWIPREWQTIQLGNYATIASGVTLGRSVSGVNAIELPYLRVANVQDGYLDLKEVKTVYIFRSELSRFRLEPGDVLMNEGGDFDKLGRGTVWEGQIENCLHQNHIFRVRCNQETLLPLYLTAYSGSVFGKAFFVKASKQTTNLASINSTQLKAFSMKLPPYPEQEAIVHRVADINAYLMIEEKQLLKLTATKSALMDDLLTGRVRVTALLSGETPVPEELEREFA